jgi:OOP family OmpA-OmpF porin
LKRRLRRRRPDRADNRISPEIDMSLPRRPLSFPVLSLFAALGAAMLGPAGASAQIGGMIRGAVNSEAQRKIDNAVSCAFNDQQCITKAKTDGKSVKVTDAKGKKVSSADSAKAVNGDASSDNTNAATPAAGGAAEAVPPGKGVWLNYDFIPGDSVLFYDDFSTDHVGDLPTHEDISSGNVTVVDLNGRKYLRTENGGTMTITLPQALPQRFTIEYTFHRKGGNGMGVFMHVGEVEGDTKQLLSRCDQGGGALEGDGANGHKLSQQDTPVDENAFETCRLMVDGGYAKQYINSVRIGQLNGLVFARTKQIRFELANSDENGALITDIRIAAGGKPMYDALISAGRVSTHGILFATGSATIQGESTPTLKEIGDMLKAHPELKLTIEGHTDNTGSAAGNLTLSDQRAAAVAKYLEDNFQVDAARLATKGYGQTKPAASNDTAEGRQQNRRVELVKM